MDILSTVGLALLTIVGIIIACEAFTNSIEWLGKKLNLSEGAVGSVLAAVGTALPETIIPILAITAAWTGGTQAGSDIGLGAIIGAPFMLSTLALAVTGTAAIVFARQGRRSAEIRVDVPLMRRDLGFFLIVYGLAVACSFIPSHPVKMGLGVLLIVAYGYYVKLTLDHPGELGEDLGPLYFARGQAEPGLGVVIAQVIAALAGIVLGAHFFVDQIAHLSVQLQIPALVLSLVVTPIATELPEKFNSVLWMRVRKDTLALGNITGAMVFQSTIPVTVGLWMTPWVLDAHTLLGAGLALLSALTVYLELTIRKQLTYMSLLRGGVFYLAFLVVVFVLPR